MITTITILIFTILSVSLGIVTWKNKIVVKGLKSTNSELLKKTQSQQTLILDLGYKLNNCENNRTEGELSLEECITVFEREVFVNSAFENIKREYSQTLRRVEKDLVDPQFENVTLKKIEGNVTVKDSQLSLVVYGNNINITEVMLWSIALKQFEKIKKDLFPDSEGSLDYLLTKITDSLSNKAKEIN